MKKIKVRAIEYFKDSTIKAYREIGEEFECDKERCCVLLKANVVKIVDDVIEEQEKTVEEIVDEVVEEVVNEVVEEVVEEMCTKKRKKSSKVVE